MMSARLTLRAPATLSLVPFAVLGRTVPTGPPHVSQSTVLRLQLKSNKHWLIVRSRCHLVASALPILLVALIAAAIALLLQELPSQFFKFNFVLVYSLFLIADLFLMLLLSNDALSLFATLLQV